MSWNLPTRDVRTFKRNTLAAVIMQLRFQPILKIADHAAGFQERVRARFPGYEQTDVQTIELMLGAPGRVVNEPAHRFRAAEGEPSVLSLVRGALALEYSAHQNRSILLRDAQTAVDALRAEYSPIAPLRLGLRYVNLINRERIGEDLGRDLQWTDLLSEDFAKIPGGLVSWDEATHFACEVSSPVNRGSMTVRYGIVPGPMVLANGQLKQIKHFRLDTDRFLENGFTVEEVGALLDGFSSDIFQVFSNVAGASLLEWMDLEGRR